MDEINGSIQEYRQIGPDVVDLNQTLLQETYACHSVDGWLIPYSEASTGFILVT